jgi:hypothetical protein
MCVCVYVCACLCGSMIARTAVCFQESRRCSVFIIRLPIAHPASLEGVHDADRRNFYTEVSKQAEAAKAVFTLAGLTCPDAFIGFEIMGDDCTLPRLLASISRVSRPGLCEVCFTTFYACTPFVRVCIALC